MIINKNKRKGKRNRKEWKRENEFMRDPMKIQIKTITKDNRRGTIKRKEWKRENGVHEIQSKIKIQISIKYK